MVSKVSGAAARVGGEVGLIVAASDYPRAPGGGVATGRTAVSPSAGISEHAFAIRFRLSPATCSKKETV